MRKRDEALIPGSCWNKAYDDEMTFILIERDPAMAATIRFWAQERVRLKINESSDAKILNAIALAGHLEEKAEAKAKVA